MADNPTPAPGQIWEATDGEVLFVADLTGSGTIIIRRENGAAIALPRAHLARYLCNLSDVPDMLAKAERLDAVLTRRKDALETAHSLLSEVLANE